MKSKQTHGFSLLEILVVMVIFGVLVTIGLRTFSTSQMRARDARRKKNLEQVANALEMYRSDKGHYPVSDDQGRIVVYHLEDEEVVYDWNDVFNDPDNQETIYMSNLPKDPSGLNYFYQAHLLNGDGTKAQAYRVYAYLENEHDPGRVGEASLPDINTSCHPTLSCNYFISTPNLTN